MKDIKSISSSLLNKNNINLAKKAAPNAAMFLLRMVLLVSIGFVIIYPLIYMIVTSLVSRNGFFNSTRVWIPEAISPLLNYKVAAELLDYGNSLWATVRYELVSALIEVCACCVTAYGFARFKFKFKGVLIGVLFLTILVPDMMVLIPRMANYSQMDILGIFGLLDKLTGIDLRPNILGTEAAFYLPSLFSMGLRSGIMIFIYMQFFASFPRELEEAAWIDGAGPIKTFLKIAVPSSGVAITTVLVFSLIWHWNDYLLCSMYLNNEYPLAMQLNLLPTNLTTMGYYLNPETPETLAFQMAGCVLFVTPMLIIYMILQRRFIESIDRVGITG
ncbi:MAG: carbohydrate ABC transporter permease [Clostridia bacterium]|nr:carbohydrate ABC transporter permease [Clostridia bacterium]